MKKILLLLAIIYTCVYYVQAQEAQDGCAACKSAWQDYRDRCEEKTTTNGDAYTNAIAKIGAICAALPDGPDRKACNEAGKAFIENGKSKASCASYKKAITDRCAIACPGGKKEGGNELLAFSNVYPNPSHGDIVVEYISNHSGSIQLTVYDPLGRVVTIQNTTIDEFAINTIALDLTNNEPGLYVLVIRDESKNSFSKFIIE